MRIKNIKIFDKIKNNFESIEIKLAVQETVPALANVSLSILIFKNSLNLFSPIELRISLKKDSV